MEYKAQFSEMKIEDTPDGRTVSGFASIFGNVDSYGDRVMPGAFKKTIKERSDRVKHLWMHNMFEPPTAAIIDMVEVTDAGELPERVRKAYPDATGGLKVMRQYLNTARGNEILEGIKAGAITEMSFGFDVMKWDNEEVKDGEMKGSVIRNLKELRLWDTSDVTWGANPATVAAKSGLPPFMMELALMSRTWLDEPDALESKAGRVLSEKNLSKLKNALQVLNDILLAAEPPAEEEDTETAKALTEQRKRKLQVAMQELAIYDLQ